MKRLALGTVQFGLAYGVANSQGQTPLAEVERILSAARMAGLDTLDTAIAYGESEQILGHVGVGQWRVITKLPTMPALPDHGAPVEERLDGMIAGSLARLRLHRLEGLLLHRPLDLLGPSGPHLFECLQTQKQRGLIGKIGVSVYEPDELTALSDRFPLDIVQIPYNPLDRRLVASGVLQQLKQLATEIHIRSVFLQGLLLMPLAARPTYFKRWQTLWDRWDAWLADNHLSPLSACLRFALSEPAIDRVIVGVDSLEQFQQILVAASGPLPPMPSDLFSDDPDLINPSRWQLRS